MENSRDDMIITEATGISTSDPILEINKLEIAFDQSEVLKNISLKLPAHHTSLYCTFWLVILIGCFITLFFVR